jgi:hypothetical protein
MKITLFSLLVLPLCCCSCSMVLVNTIPTKTGAALRPGADRIELISRLGQPSFTTTNLIPVPIGVTILRTNQPAHICDSYKVSRLVQVGNDPYSTDWNVYPAFVIITFGLTEVVIFPYVTVDLTMRGFQHQELRVWYDDTDKLVAWGRTSKYDD